MSNDRGLVYKSIKGRWWPVDLPLPLPFTAAPARSPALHACTLRCACLCTAQGQTSLRDRWSNTHAAHLSLRRPRNMSSSRATVVFPFRGNCRFSVIYRKPSTPSLPPPPPAAALAVQRWHFLTARAENAGRGERSRCSGCFLEIYAKSSLEGGSSKLLQAGDEGYCGSHDYLCMEVKSVKWNWLLNAWTCIFFKWTVYFESGACPFSFVSRKRNSKLN